MRVETDAGAIDLGITETTPTIGIVDYSRRVTDDFGVTTVVQRGFARTMSLRIMLPTDDVDVTQRRLAALRSTAALWVADDDFASLSVNGFYKDFSLDFATATVSYCTLTIEGLTVTEPITDTGGDAAPDGQQSSFRLLRPVDVTDAVLISSSVAEADYPEWSATANYDAGDRVIKAGTHRAYESMRAANVGYDPAGTSGLWLDIGPTGRWAMFDQALGTATSAGGSIAVTLDAGAAGAVALLDVVGSTVRVQAPGYDHTVAVGPGAITFLDLPGVDGNVTVTIAGTGTVSVGTLLIGDVVGLGITEAGPQAGITDYSRKVVDDFGEVTIVQRAWAKRMTAKALIDTAALDNVVSRIAGVRARPCLWIGQTGTDSLTIYGFFKDFSVEVAQNVSKLSLSIEGLSTAAPVAPSLRSELDDLAQSIFVGGVARDGYHTETDRVIYLADGRPVRTHVEEIGLVVDGHSLFVTTLQEVSAETGTSKWMMTVKADGTIVGMEAVAGGGLADLKFTGSRFYFVDNSGENPINAMVYDSADGVWKMHAIEVDKLKVNTAIVPVRAASVTPVAGTEPDIDAFPVPAPVETVVIEMKVPGWIEAGFGGQQGYDSPGPYAANIKVNGVQIPEAVAGGGSSSGQDNFRCDGSYYAATAGDYVVSGNWNAGTAVSLNQRSLFAKGYPSTE